MQGGSQAKAKHHRRAPKPHGRKPTRAKPSNQKVTTFKKGHKLLLTNKLSQALRFSWTFGAGQIVPRGRSSFFCFLFRVFLSRNSRFEPPLLFTSLLDLFLYNVIVCKNIQDLVSLSAQAQHRRHI
jgi:hypothetical protein